MSSQFLTRAELLTWGANWSVGDAQLIESFLDRLELTKFKQPARGDYVGCSRDSGPYLMTIHPGYLGFHKNHIPDECRTGEDWLPLSSFKARSQAGHETERVHSYCPDCFLQLPLSGVCTECS